MDVKTQSLTKPADQPIRREKDKQMSFPVFLALLLAIVLVVRIFIFSPFSIPSESMLPLLRNGDYLLAAKWPYGYSKYSVPFNAPLIPERIFAGQPKRGDVVIFKHPIDDVDYIKRVIGLPGDSVAVQRGQVILNGKPVPRERLDDIQLTLSVNTSCAWGGEEQTNVAGEPVCAYHRFRETLPNGRQYDVLDFGLSEGDEYPATIIPEGRLFVLGDNRDNSRDSRFEARAGDAVGMVPQEKLVARASVIMWSTDGSAEWLKPWTWFSAARWDRIGETL